MSLKVWKVVVGIQRSFLWVGVSLGKKVMWVKWAGVCRPKNEGSLGVKDLWLFNSSLLEEMEMATATR